MTKKDTVTYNVKSFSDGTERTVEDILKKLPGIKVAEDGKVSINGKPIQKVMIEGEDIFSKNYKLITRNMSLAFIDKIEAIDNYTENKLLNGVENSGQTILNLNIKDESKRQVFGNVAFGGGVINRYDLNMNVFSLQKKLKYGIVSNSNNIGYDPVSDSEFYLERDTPQQVDSPISQISSNFPNISNLESSRYTFNRANLIGLNANYKFSTKSKIQAFGYFNNDYNRNSTLTENFINVNNGNIYYRDFAEATRKPVVFIGQIKFDYELGKNSSIKIVSNNRTLERSSTNRIFSENIVLNEQIFEKINNRKIESENVLNFVSRISDKSAIIADLSYLSSKVPIQKNFESYRYSTFFGVDSTFKTLNNDIEYETRSFVASLKYKTSTKIGKFVLGVVHINNSEIFNSESNLNNGLQSIILDMLFQNSSFLKKKSYIIESQQNFQINKFRAMIGVSASWVNTHSFDNLRSISINEKTFFINPSISFGFDVDNKQKMLLLYNIQTIIPTIAELSSGYSANDYRNFNRFAPKFYENTNELYMLSYRYNNWEKLFLFNLNCFYSLKKSSLISDYSFYNTLSFQTNEIYKNPIKLYAINAQMEKLIAPLSIKIKMENSYERIEQITKITNDFRNGILENWKNNIYLLSAFDGYFNFDFGISQQLFKQKSEFSDATNQVNNLLKFNFSVRYKPSNNFYIKATNSYYTWVKSFSNETNFLDLYINYSPNKSNWKFDIVAKNLLNNKNLYLKTLTNFSSVSRQIELQPLQIILKAEFRFPN